MNYEQIQQHQPQPQIVRRNVKTPRIEFSMFWLNVFELVMFTISVSFTIRSPTLSSIIGSLIIYALLTFPKLFFLNDDQLQLPAIKRFLQCFLFLDFKHAITDDQRPNTRYLRFERMDKAIMLMVVFNLFHMLNGGELGENSEEKTFQGFESQISEFFRLVMCLALVILSFSCVELLKYKCAGLYNQNQDVLHSTTLQRILHFLYSFSSASIFSLTFRMSSNAINKNESSGIEIAATTIFVVLFGAALSMFVLKKNKMLAKIIRRTFTNQNEQAVMVWFAIILTLESSGIFDVLPIYRDTHPEYSRIFNHYTMIPIRLLTLERDLKAYNFLQKYYFSASNESISWLPIFYLIQIVISIGFTAIQFVHSTLQIFYETDLKYNIKEITKTSSKQSQISQGIAKLQNQNPYKNQRQICIENETVYRDLIGEGEFKKMEKNPTLNRVSFQLKEEFFDSTEQEQNCMLKIMSCMGTIKQLQHRSSFYYREHLIAYISPSVGMIVYWNRVTEHVVLRFLETQSSIEGIDPRIKFTLALEISIVEHGKFRLMSALLNRIPLFQLEISSVNEALLTRVQMKQFFQNKRKNQSALILSACAFYKSLSPLLMNNPNQILCDLYEDEIIIQQ